MRPAVIVGAFVMCSWTAPVLAAQVADSRSEFSCTQGLNNWYYGYYDGPFVSSDFRAMTQCFTDPYYPGQSWWADRSLYWTSIRSAVSFPNGPASCGRQRVEHWAVRRWVSEVSGTIDIAGTVRNALGGFDGFTAHIFVDGAAVWSRTVAGAGSTTAMPYAVRAAVNRDSIVDFAIQPNQSDCNDHAEFIITISSDQLPTPGLPLGPPIGLTAVVSGTTVTLAWGLPASGDSPTSYILEAGSSPGALDLARYDTLSPLRSFVALAVAPGNYFIRVRARNAAGIGPPSNEVMATVGGGPAPCVSPGAPSGLSASIAGAIVTLRWTAAGGQLSTYVLEAGSFSGSSNLANFETGSLSTVLVATGPPGTYFVRVRGRNACGLGPPSNEVIVIIP